LSTGNFYPVILNLFQDLERSEIPKQVRNDNKQVQHDTLKIPKKSSIFRSKVPSRSRTKSIKQ